MSAPALRMIRGGAGRPAGPAGDGGDPRPLIVVTTEIHEMAAAAEAALASGVELYQRGTDLVTVVRAKEDDRARRTPQAPFFRCASHATLLGELSRCSRWVEWKGKKNPELVAVRPDGDAISYLRDRGTWTLIQRAEGILEAPAFLPSGGILEAPGYDAATGYLYAPGDTFLPIPENPDQAQARACLEMLIEPFADFPHAGEDEKGDAVCGPARAAAVAAVLTLLSVPAIDGSFPLFVFDASLRRSGKSLQTDVIALIATGRKSPRQSWPEDDEEAEKTLSGYALAGDPLVCFDNLRRTFGGAKLEACITCPRGGTVPFRRFGTQEIVKLPWRSVVLASGNNVTLTPDIAQRSLVIRIEPDREDPERRIDFRIPGGADALRAWVEAARPRLVWAALTLLRAWHLAGRPCEGVRAMGGFEAWRRIVPAALVWAGAADPLGCIGGLDGDDADPETEALRVVVDLWPRLEAVCESMAFGETPSGKGITVTAGLDMLRRLERDRKERGDNAPADGFDDLREALQELTRTPPGRPLDARAVGNVFRGQRRRILDGRRLTVPKDDGKSRKSKRWTVQDVRRKAPSGA